MSLITKYLSEDKLNYKPSLIFPSCLTEIYGDEYIDKNDLNRMLKLEEEAKAKNKLIPNPDISDHERTMRRFHSHKPDYCGSCFQEQKYDHLKYCHSCQRDPHYNPDNLAIGSGTKSIQDYNPIKESMMRETQYALGCQGTGVREEIKLGTVMTDWEEFKMYKEFMKMKLKHQ